jgi:hypothetical protein
MAIHLALSGPSARRLGETEREVDLKSEEAELGDRPEGRMKIIPRLFNGL